MVDAPEPSQAPPRRYNTRRSVAALSQSSNSQLASSNASKPSKPAPKKGRRLKAVVENEKDRHDHPSPEPQVTREPVIEAPLQSRTPRSHGVRRSSSVGDELLEFVQRRMRMSSPSKENEGRRADSSSAEIESSLVPIRRDVTVSSNHVLPKDGRHLHDSHPQRHPIRNQKLRQTSQSHRRPTARGVWLLIGCLSTKTTAVCRSLLPVKIYS